MHSLLDLELAHQFDHDRMATMGRPLSRPARLRSARAV